MLSYLLFPLSLVVDLVEVWSRLLSGATDDCLMDGGSAELPPNVRPWI